MTATDDLLAACAELLARRQEVADLVRSKDDALRRMHTEEGVPKGSVASVAREALAERFSPDEISKLGVSDGNVRLAVDRGPRA